MRARLVVHRLFCTMQAKMDAFFAPPASVRGMKKLDKAAFRREVTLPAVFLQPSLCTKFLKRLNRVVLKYPRIRKIQTLGADDVGEGKKVWHSEMAVYAPSFSPVSLSEL